ncbi:molybdopterin-containing oxidoreductase family protein [Dendrosporobacter sp. 1207_IL3150]|uniref:molybdopterin-containing oxidoreductase family protein n=1 Tax=Dendrosporobacter sp. 1207_IL3150 TaxID=3084054 RepID=UPI002FDA9941
MVWDKKFTRRSFLKAVTVAGSAVAASELFSFDNWLQAAESAPTVTKISLCGSCSNECGMVVHLKNSRVWKVEGHPDHPYSKGKLCARGHSSIAWPYSPDRLTKPLKRVGEGKYEPISWEQAYSEIGDQLKNIAAAAGPGSIFFAHNPRPTNSFYGPRLMHALGSPNVMTHGTSCRSGRDVGYAYTMGDVPSADISGAKYIVFLGRNYAEGIRPSSLASLTSSADKKAKIVIVDPRLNNTMPLASEWVPIRPGTDLALLLAISNVLISENLYDADFVAKNTVGFEELKKGVEFNTPEWAEEITGISSATIKRIARELAAAKPKALLEPSWKGAYGCSYQNSSQTARAAACVNGLLGNLGKPGGLFFGVNVKFGSLNKNIFPEPPKSKIERADGSGVKGKFPLSLPKDGIPQLMAQKAAEGTVKAGIVYRHNMVRNYPDPQFMADGLKKLELLVVVDIQMSEMAEIAHYILPETSFLERDEVVGSYAGKKPCVMVRSKVIDVLHSETRPFHEIITNIAHKSGVGKYFNFTLDELNTAMLEPLGIKWSDFKNKGIVMAKEEWKEGFPALKTASKKVEFYSQAFVDAGFPGIPVWESPLAVPAKGEFYLIHGKQAHISHTSTANNPYLLQIAKDYNLERLWINTSKAAELGIKDGDNVTVESDLAQRSIKVKVTERIHPDAVFLPMGYGSFAKGLKTAANFGVSMNDFAPFRLEPISGHCMMAEAVVRVRKGVK